MSRWLIFRAIGAVVAVVIGVVVQLVVPCVCPVHLCRWVGHHQT